jgi:hypothetical protein
VIFDALAEKVLSLFGGALEKWECGSLDFEVENENTITIIVTLKKKGTES